MYVYGCMQRLTCLDMIQQVEQFQHRHIYIYIFVCVYVSISDSSYVWFQLTCFLFMTIVVLSGELFCIISSVLGHADCVMVVMLLKCCI